MKPKKVLLLFAVTATSLFYGCSENPADRKLLEVNKKYTLESWPDENYIAELDSILKAEPLKPDAEEEKTALTIYSGAMPTVKLPGEKKQTARAGERRTAATGQKETSASHRAERFADRFMNALSEWQSDPSNAAKYRIVPAKAGDDLFRLLSRAYGNDAMKLPKFYTLSALQSVNPNVRLEHLEAGDQVRIPVLER